MAVSQRRAPIRRRSCLLHCALEHVFEIESKQNARPCYDSFCMARKHSKPASPAPAFPDPYRELWVSLTPAQRLRRSWRLRLRLRALKMSHDAKTFQQL